MNEYELNDLLKIGQDEHQRPVSLDAPALKFKVTAPPTSTAMLLEQILGQTSDEFRSDVQKARSLEVAETLNRATDIPELEKAASVFGTTIEQEMVKLLRKATTPNPAPFPTAVGAIPSARPQTTPAARSPKSSERRRKLKEMFIAAGVPRTAYTEETIEALVTAMESYLDSVLE
jgi:hypothetical protein